MLNRSLNGLLGNYRVDYSTSSDYSSQMPKCKTCLTYRQASNDIFLTEQVERRLVDGSQEHSNCFRERINIFRSFKNSNILPVYEFLFSSNNYYIVHQLYTSNLESYAEKKNPAVTEAIRIIIEIAKAINCFEEMGIAHGNLSLKTVFMKESTVKVGGFLNPNLRKSMDNTFGDMFSAKQTHESGKVTDKSDVWSLGCIFYSLIHPSSFESMKKMDGCTFAALRFQKKLVIDDKLSNEVKDFLNKTIVLNEKDRISWVEMLAHPIFNGTFKQSITKLSGMKNTRLLDFPKLGKVIESITKEPSIIIDITRFEQLMRFFIPRIQEKDILNSFNQFGPAVYSIVRPVEFDQPLQRIVDTNPAENPGTNLHFLLKKSSKQEHQKKNADRLKRVSNLFAQLSQTIAKQKASLQDLFKQFSQKGGKMTKKDLQRLIGDIDKSCLSDADFLFQFIDTDKSGEIDFEEFKFYFNLQIQNRQIKQSKLEQELNKRVQNFFSKLHAKLKLRKLTFEKAFLAYNRQKDGNLSLLEFTNMINVIIGGFQSDQIKTIFNYIALDGKDTLEMNVLYNYYLQVNNLQEKQIKVTGI